MIFESKCLSLCGICEAVSEGEGRKETLREAAVSRILPLMQNLGWGGDEIGILLAVTQTPDFYLPATAFAIQKDAGIGERAMVYDINQGGTGFAAACRLVDSLMAVSDAGEKALCVFGDISDGGNLVTVAAFEKKEPRSVRLESRFLPGTEKSIFQKSGNDPMTVLEDRDDIRRQAELLVLEKKADCRFSNLPMGDGYEECEPAYRYSSSWIPHILFRRGIENKTVDLLAYGAGIEIVRMQIDIGNPIYVRAGKRKESAV